MCILIIFLKFFFKLTHFLIESIIFTLLCQHIFFFLKVSWRVIFKPRRKELYSPQNQELKAFNQTRLFVIIIGNPRGSSGLGFTPLCLLGSCLKGLGWALGSGADSPRTGLLLPDLVALIRSPLLQ